MIKSILIDARNIAELKQDITVRIRNADFIGIDLETHDQDAHQGIKDYRKNDDTKVFDLQRTTITGLSLYPGGHDKAYYFNLNHADVENRLNWGDVKSILDQKRSDAWWVAHNAPYEIANLRISKDYWLENIICSMQMCVSCYGPDEYSEDALIKAGLGEMGPLIPSIMDAFIDFQSGGEMNAKQGKVFGQICGKTSKSSFSYNGYVRDISYGYGLKKAVKSHFGYKMQTFDETLNGKRHMGELTGEEVVSYGCDDAYWAVRLMHHLFKMMRPNLITTFFEQENPMIHVYADIWCEGFKINATAISDRRAYEREHFAEVLRDLRSDVRQLFPAPAEPNESLAKRDKWYRDGWQRYRDRIEKWAMEPNRNTAFDEAMLVNGSVPKPWCKEEGGNPNKLYGPNFSHYMVMRTLLYDLMGEKLIVEKGKTQSDGEARGKMIERLQGEPGAEHKIKIIEGLNKIASIEQAMKLYLNPYTLLTDPETEKVYPVVSSKLSTRRMASSFPNPMQLAKQGDTVYVRDFFQADAPDHLLVSLDWSQVELVLIGEFSGDPEFARAYSQLPYNDLHKVAAADILSAMYDVAVTPDMISSLKKMEDEIDEPFGFPLVDALGNRLSPFAAYKYNRGTDGGKGANFNYWYSGALSSVAQKRGIDSDLMWKMTDAYRQRFAIAEAWRVNTIDFLRENGYVELPDGHRRNRFEATHRWSQIMEAMFGVFDHDAVQKFGYLFCNSIARRAGNQGVNALIQGSCSTLAKRSILKIREEIKHRGLRANFKMPIHDEVVFSVHHRDVVPFIKLARGVMTNHPDIIKNLKLHCTASVGRTLGPYHKTKNRFGQIELDEAPGGLDFIPDDMIDTVLPEEKVEEVVRYLHAA